MPSLQVGKGFEYQGKPTMRSHPDTNQTRREHERVVVHLSA